MVTLVENNFSRRHGRNTRPKIRAIGAISGFSSAVPCSSVSSGVQNNPVEKSVESEQSVDQRLFVDRCSSFVERSADNWQAIETRTNGTASSDVTSQTIWSASYINAAVLQDTYSGGTIQPNSRLYFEQDANWDTTAVVGYDSTTQTWGVVQRYVYSAYGNITILNADWSATASGTQPMVNNLYQGMTLDSVTGLYYARMRNYSPSLGVWTSQDPAGYINGANTYQFVMDNPVEKVDPDGLELASMSGPWGSPPIDSIGPNVNNVEVISGGAEFVFGAEQMLTSGPLDWEPAGWALAGNGFLQSNAGLYELLNGFGANLNNPLPGSILQAVSTPPVVEHAIDTVTGRSPANAIDAIEEAVNANKLLQDLENFLHQLGHAQPSTGTCKDQPDAMLGQDV